MQTPALSSPAPSPDTLNMIRNPIAATPPNSQTSNGQTAAKPPADGQTPQEHQPAPSGTQQAPTQTVQTPQGTVVVPQPSQTIPGMPSVLPGMELPELPTVEVPGSTLLETLVPRRDGLFQAFLQKLADMPSFPEDMNQLILNLIPTTENAEIPAELDALVQMLPQNESQAVELLRQQVSGGTKFTGELFDLLRDAYSQSTTKEAKNEILQFVRRFNDYTSSDHIEHAMLRTLEQLEKTSPREYSAELKELTQTLKTQLSDNERPAALKLLQGKVLPFLREIGDRHPDIRLPNTLISIFKPLAARYENSSEEGLLQAFRQLVEHNTTIKSHLGKRSTGDLMKLVRETDFARARENQRFAEQLAKTADWAMKGKGGGEPRKMFRQMISNLLMNKSVYLPLEHAILPMEWNGKQVVAELWADPDARNGPQSENEDDRLIRFLLHMDIPGLGPVDLALANCGETVDMELACPEAVVPFSMLIQTEMTRILENNGFKPSAIQIKKWEKPLSLATAFPKITKGENGVNMKI